jgi:hypothetical protein
VPTDFDVLIRSYISSVTKKRNAERYLDDNVIGAGYLQALALAEEEVRLCRTTRRKFKFRRRNLHSTSRSLAEERLVARNDERLGAGDVVCGSRLGGGRLVVLTPRVGVDRELANGLSERIFDEVNRSRLLGDSESTSTACRSSRLWSPRSK